MDIASVIAGFGIGVIVMSGAALVVVYFRKPKDPLGIIENCVPSLPTEQPEDYQDRTLPSGESPSEVVEEVVDLEHQVVRPDDEPTPNDRQADFPSDEEVGLLMLVGGDGFDEVDEDDILSAEDTIPDLRIGDELDDDTAESEDVTHETTVADEPVEATPAAPVHFEQPSITPEMHEDLIEQLRARAAVMAERGRTIPKPEPMPAQPPAAAAPPVVEEAPAESAVEPPVVQPSEPVIDEEPAPEEPVVEDVEEDEEPEDELPPVISAPPESVDPGDFDEVSEFDQFDPNDL